MQFSIIIIAHTVVDYCSNNNGLSLQRLWTLCRIDNNRMDANIGYYDIRKDNLAKS